MAKKPQQIQLRRTKGFDLQAVSLALNGLPAVKVDRRTKWGNPFHSVREPLRTITAKADTCIAASHLVKLRAVYRCSAGHERRDEITFTINQG